MKKITYSPKGVCSREMQVEIDDNGIITSVHISGGCAGNTQGVSRLIEGMDAKKAIEKISGIRCGFKSTSCPNELAKAIAECLGE
ncbi:MAG: TIGR03905 family TSCPD domain-containing protein [Ruminococcaceae bacterium]|nr:TIGR03905 family TSCPD domain-containing protein [Oscillospiraceae bacterium]